jgi:hypothetical protein
MTAPDDLDREEIAPDARLGPSARDVLLSGLEATRSEPLAIDTALQVWLRRTASPLLRERRDELRRLRPASPARDEWSIARTRVEQARAALDHAVAAERYLVERAPPRRTPIARRRHRDELAITQQRRAALKAELQRNLDTESALEQQVRRMNSHWVAANHEVLAELRLIEEELAHRAVIERRLSTPHEQVLTR